ncbi:WD repeat-containing protein 75 isoform X1 [Coffea eugenioides]|uniref:WD repeat-containing protein 75 isoform X1 n=1 Tax=Coffea eugenioides TaxID=49369 RepID=UPI000F60C985|nr:WD repeat-containing protein 75 isoform X1 [Coffea eugenioides]
MIKVGGKSYTSSPPAFSNDTNKLLVCTGNTVSIFSASTGLLINELEGHTALVTSVVVVPPTSPANKILAYCWTASLDGTIRYWDFSAPELMKTINIRVPIHSMVVPGLLRKPADHGEQPSHLFAYLCTEEVKKQGHRNASAFWQIRKCNLTQSRFLDKFTLAETLKPQIITISPFGNYIGICEKHKLRIWEIPARDANHVAFKKMRLHHTKTFTTLAFHPTERIVAAGDGTGRILVWRGVGEKTFSGGDNNLVNGASHGDAEEKPGVRQDDDADSCTTWHWHSAEVNVLLFSADGAYLFSGGKEGVLVLWQLDTGKRKFLPRIGSPLLYFTNSLDPSLSSVSCADNLIHLLKMPSMVISRSISGIKPPSSVLQFNEGSCSGVAFNHSDGLAAICTENYRIQFYSLFDDREISEVQVCERNHQPGEEITVIVNLVALSPDGYSMGTVETRLPEEGIGGLVSLKFWECSSQSKEFSLSTVVYEPHRDAGVSDVAFHPTRQMAVSSSYGADFKVWKCGYGVSGKDQKPQSNGWTCHAAGSYKKKPMTAATFSMDGSVLAVAAENVITLWDPDRNFLVAVIGESIEPIRKLSFVGKSDYLVSASQGSNPELFLWSMSNLSVLWSYKLHAEAVSCATDGSSFAVLAHLPTSSKSTECLYRSTHGVDGVILLFPVDKAIPISTWFVQKAQGGSLAFIDASSRLEDGNAGRKSVEVLTYINGAHEYVLLDPFGESAPIRCTSQPESLVDFGETAGRYGYTSIYGKLPEFNIERERSASIATAASERSWEMILDGPSHNLPPFTTLCSAFLESLLERRTATVE